MSISVRSHGVVLQLTWRGSEGSLMDVLLQTPDSTWSALSPTAEEMAFVKSGWLLRQSE